MNELEENIKELAENATAEAEYKFFSIQKSFKRGYNKNTIIGCILRIGDDFIFGTNQEWKYLVLKYDVHYGDINQEFEELSLHRASVNCFKYYYNNFHKQKEFEIESAYKQGMIDALTGSPVEKMEEAARLKQNGVPMKEINEQFNLGINEYPGWDLPHDGVKKQFFDIKKHKHLTNNVIKLIKQTKQEVKDSNCDAKNLVVVAPNPFELNFSINHEGLGLQLLDKWELNKEDIKSIFKQKLSSHIEDCFIVEKPTDIHERYEFILIEPEQFSNEGYSSVWVCKKESFIRNVKELIKE